MEYQFITNVIINSLTKEAVSPVLECVNAQSDGTFTASFGYNNPNAYAAEVPSGDSNHFTPTAQANAQTELFLMGRHQAVFTVPFNGDNLVWTLNGHTSTASSNSKRC